jgi:acetylornithine/succinyldiaminopimelate/putrescine aminotransferase
VRMLPPLIVEEPEIAEAVARIDRAATRLEAERLAAAEVRS